jgi:hypothetical protein
LQAAAIRRHCSRGKARWSALSTWTQTWSAPADLGLIDTVLAWRDRLGKLVFGPNPTLAQSTRAVVAFCGLQDCCLQFPDTRYDSLRESSVEAALAALGM